jgi:ATP-dependent exoDNAse (exonuclease V) beta subunit
VSDPGLARLAPAFAEALRSSAFAGALQSPGFGGTAPQLDALDRALLDRARAGVARWLALADRVTPSELIDFILADAAYAFELRGRRLAQARENLKKIRGLVRRVESRGYATLGRLSAYFETLKAGDESSAVVEASGCVSLMTIHAAKGLEFPIVFLVNLQTPGRGRLSGFSIIERGPAGEPEVAFGATEATRLEDQRDDEELRRVLYVAVTRARDRLYLSAELDGRGRLKRGPRSLAGLLPGGLSDAIAAAAVAGKDLALWESSHGSFAFRICRPTEAEPIKIELAAPVAADAVSSPAAALSPVNDASFDRVPLSAGQQVHVAATLAAGLAPPAARPLGRSSGTASDRLLGTLVHRLFQRRVNPASTEADVRALVPRLIRAEEGELVGTDDVSAAAANAAALYLAFRRRPDVAGLLEAGRADYEVPFSFRPPGRPGELIRGVVDCVVEAADGTITVVEFKTGGPRPEHEVQAGLYAEALRAAWPGRTVAVKILYP